MNPNIVDPDMKVNMSLDEIISLTRNEIKSQLPKRNRRRRKFYPRTTKDHSVPLLSSTCGVNIYVSRKSSLLNAEHRRRIIQAVSNRTINSDLIQKSKEIIPAEYKLVKTHTGVERVLVPAPEYYSKGAQQSKPSESFYSQQNPGVSSSFPDKPPPLMSVPIYSPPKEMKYNTPMEVDEDDDIVELNLPAPDKKLEVIDLECDLPVEVVEAKKMCLPSTSSAPQQVSSRGLMENDYNTVCSCTILIKKPIGDNTAARLMLLLSAVEDIPQDKPIKRLKFETQHLPA